MGGVSVTLIVHDVICIQLWSKRMTRNLLIIGLDGRVFNFPVEKDVQTTTAKQWLAQKQVSL